MTDGTLYQLAAFSRDNQGGNPAGVWVGDELPSADEMQRIAADVGASETAFIAPSSGSRRTVRYYSPEIEVSFCGHATIASGVALGCDEDKGEFTFETLVGEVVVTTERHGEDVVASLRSVDTKQESIDDTVLAEALDSLAWTQSDLDSTVPPMKAYAGAWHLVLAVNDHATLLGLDYNFEALKALMQREDLTTLQLVWRESERLFYSRNPFPVGGITEDPATGAAAAALGGYLRDAGIVTAPFEFRIRQGDEIGMPSEINVAVPTEGGIVVSGEARQIQAASEQD